MLRVRFEHFKVCKRLVEIGRVGCEHLKACRRLLEVRSLRFEHRKASGRLVEGEFVLSNTTRVGRLYRLGESVFNIVSM